MAHLGGETPRIRQTTDYAMLHLSLLVFRSHINLSNKSHTHLKKNCYVAELKVSVMLFNNVAKGSGCSGMPSDLK